MLEPSESAVLPSSSLLSGSNLVTLFLKEQARIKQRREAEARRARQAETANTKLLAIREAGIVAATMTRFGRNPGVAAITPEIEAFAWSKKTGRSTKPGTFRSPRAMARNAEKSRAMQEQHKFVVWDLGTTWQWGSGEGEDSAIYTEGNCLGRYGSIYHGTHATAEGFTVVRQLPETANDLERYSSVREGLARLVVANGLNLEL